MEQMTIDDFLQNDLNRTPELIAINMSRIGFHWIRITKGFVPIEFKRFVDMEDNCGYSDIHVGTDLRDKIISAFKGEVAIFDNYS